MKTIDKVALLLIRNCKVLFVRSKGKDTFYTLGGKRESGESDIETIVREAREEIGVEVVVSSLKYLASFHDVVHDAQDIPLKLTCYLGEVDGVPKASSEIEEIAWIDSSTTCRLSKTGMDVLKLLKAKILIN